MLGLAAVLDLNVRLPRPVDDLEGEVLHVRLDLRVLELASDKTLGVEDRVVGVHRDLVLGRITDQTLVVGERDVGWCRAVTLVVGDDLYAIILPDTNAPAKIA